VHQVRVRVDPAGNREQAACGEFPLSRHRAAELGDPAAGDAEVGDLLVTRRHDDGTADYEVKSHQGIVALAGYGGVACHGHQTLAWWHAEFPAA